MALWASRLVLGFGGLLGRRFGRTVSRISSKHPPSEPDDSERRDKERDAHREPRRDPFACFREEYHGARVELAGTGTAACPCDSRRSRSGMKLRTGGTFSKL